MPTSSLTLPGRVVVKPTKHDVFDELAADLIADALNATRERGAFHLALSGGSTPEPFYMSLVTDPRWRVLDWSTTHVWIVDERRVPEDDEKSNVRMIREALLDHVDMPDDQVHPMPVFDEDPASAYETEMRAAFGQIDLPRLDFVILGMGGDCHTASLFPDSPALDITDRWVSTNDGEKVVPPPRVTMTYPLLNAGRRLAVLLSGQGKHAALKRVADQHATGTPDSANIPISGIDPAPMGGELVWYLDEDAALGGPAPV